jgi:two-component system sensor histidine kinase KdpD
VPTALASVLSVAVFDFFFVPPYLSFAVADTEHLITFTVMLIVALVISGLTVRIRAQAIGRGIASGASPPSMP